MGCLPSSCSIPCCCCCVNDYTCCPCRPGLFPCGCSIKDGRYVCRWDACRKYTDSSGTGRAGTADTENEVGTANSEMAGSTPRKRTRREEKSGVVRWGGKGASGDAPGVDPEGDRWTGEGDAPLELTDPVLGVVVRPSSSISQSTGMEPMVSDDSRTPSMISDGDSDFSSRTDSEREGVCIDGKFYPKRPDTSASKTGGFGSSSMGSEFTINNIISVHIANKVRHDDEDTPRPGDTSRQPPPPSAAPRRLAKIDIKEERKKILSELSLFKKKPKRRKQKKRKLTGQVNVTFDPDLDLIPRDPKSQMEVIQDQEQSSSSARSMHISSAEDDSSGVDNFRIRHLVSAKAKVTINDVTPRNVTVDPLPENNHTNLDNISTTSSSAEDNEAIPNRLRTPSLIAENGDGDSYTGSQQSGEQRTVPASSDSPAFQSNSTNKKSPSRYGAPTLHPLPPRPQPPRPQRTPASLFTAASLNSNPLSRNTGNDRPTARGLSMSRHFQGQGQQQYSGFTAGGAASGSGTTGRPQSAAGARTVTSAASGMWTVGLAGGETEGSRGAHSAGNSDQDSGGSSSHGRPSSTYGIRTHSEAVHSLQRWRNLKVNPF